MQVCISEWNMRRNDEFKRLKVKSFRKGNLEKLNLCDKKKGSLGVVGILNGTE